MFCDMFSSVCITNSEVENMIESDHFPVVMTINVAQNTALTVDHSEIVQVNEQTEFIEKIIRQGDKEQIYRDQLSSDEGQRAFEAAKAKLENNVDDAVSDFVECLTSASQCMIKKCHMKKHIKGAARNDDECKKAKKERKEKLRKFRRTRKPDRRKEYADSNKRYRRMTRVKKQEFKRKKAAFLATNLKNASVFWKELKSLGGKKRSSVSDKIDISEWYDHFKSILGHTFNETADQSNNQENDLAEDADHFLNQEITADEVQKAVTNLKPGKACGLDNVLADMLKAGGQEVILFMTKLFNTIFDKGIYPSEWA